VLWRQRKPISHSRRSPPYWSRGIIGRGLGQALAKALGEAGINLSLLTAQVVGRRYAAMFGFENEADAAKATALIKKAAAPVRKR
jgi:hypothetical protein